MRVTSKHFLAAAGLAAIVIAGYLAIVRQPEKATDRARDPVQVVKTGLAEKKSIPVTIYANGYITAIQTVDVRPQVQNVVRAVHVTEGREVRAGQLLFTLDERNDIANVNKARAQLARDQADLTDAEITLRRNQELQAKNFISQAVVDTARNKVASLRATVEADIAALQSSKVELDYNRITAGISGRIGTIGVHPGSLVQPAGAPMVTISQMDPIAVSFSVPEKELAHIRASYPRGDAPVIAQLAGNKELKGKLSFIDNAVDTQTGTIRMKARFANPSRLLWPGSYVNVRLISRTLPDAVVIPAQAIVTGPTDKFVYIVQADGTITNQKIEVAAIENGEAVVSGLSPGARIVLEGAQNLRPTSKVREMQASQTGTRHEGRNPS
ncbi:MAG TPA: efflux RND transporter periplasmic adaptor subunit [Burkholderiaceae bacterium]|nr:efflux RND transporter periplasmic adaptor subunit [Burkholderiaceae bacterium]